MRSKDLKVGDILVTYERFGHSFHPHYYLIQKVTPKTVILDRFVVECTITRDKDAHFEHFQVYAGSNKIYMQDEDDYP